MKYLCLDYLDEKRLFEEPIEGGCQRILGSFHEAGSLDKQDCAPEAGHIPPLSWLNAIYFGPAAAARPAGPASTGDLHLPAGGCGVVKFAVLRRKFRS
jgi:hypothetical protein